MLPEVGASELIVLAAVALIVVGPKDLPMLLRRVGQMVRKLRLLAADFRASFDDMARQSELDDLRKEVEALRSTTLSDAIGPMPTFDEIGDGLKPTSAAVTYDDTQDKIDAGFDPLGVAGFDPVANMRDHPPEQTILPAAEEPAKPAPKPRAPSKPKAAAPGPAKAPSKAVAKPVATPKPKAKSAKGSAA